MLVTLVLSMTPMVVLFLLIFVALVKDKRLFQFAPKDIQAAWVCILL